MRSWLLLFCSIFMSDNCNVGFLSLCVTNFSLLVGILMKMYYIYPLPVSSMPVQAYYSPRARGQSQSVHDNKMPGYFAGYSLYDPLHVTPATYEPTHSYSTRRYKTEDDCREYERPRARRDSHPASRKPSLNKLRLSTTKGTHKANEEDARRASIPIGYCLKNWDPTEEPIMLLGSVFDANSIGKGYRTKADNGGQSFSRSLANLQSTREPKPTQVFTPKRMIALPTQSQLPLNQKMGPLRGRARQTNTSWGPVQRPREPEIRWKPPLWDLGDWGRNYHPNEIKFERLNPPTSSSLHPQEDAYLVSHFYSTFIQKLRAKKAMVLREMSSGSRFARFLLG